MITVKVTLLVAGGLTAMSACTGDTGNSGTPLPPATSAIEKPTPESIWADVPRGRAPVVPYVRGHHYINPQGKGSVLPAGRGGVSGVVVFSGGLLVSDAVYFEGTSGLALVRHGNRVRSWPSGRHCSSGTPVTSFDGGYVAWVTLRCPESVDRTIGAVHRARGDGSDEMTQSVGPGLAGAVGFLGRRVVYNAGFQDGAWVTGFRGDPRRIPGVDRVQSVSRETGWLIGRRGARARLVVDADGRVRWRARAGDLVAFNPDGTKVLALEKGQQIAVLQGRDGSTLASVDLPAGAEPEATVWETDSTLLTLMRRAGQVTVVRVYLDGRFERVTPLADPNGGRSPYVLLEPSSSA